MNRKPPIMQQRARGLGMLVGLVALAGAPGVASAQSSTQSTTASGQPAASQAGGSDENLTVLGHRNRFQPAPVPGAPLGPPPDKPAPHLGRYKISGDQSRKDGYDTQTGAYIAPFGTAYTGASPTADGLASRFGH